MTLLLIAIWVLVGTGLVAFIAGRKPRVSSVIGVSGAILGSVLGVVPAAQSLLGHDVSEIHLPWQTSLGGSFYLEIDALSAFFLIPMFVVTALSSLYGSTYLPSLGGRRSVGTAALFFNVLTASLALVLTARNGLLFLLAWEVMTLAAYALIILDRDDPKVRAAGWTFLVASHLGTAFLFVMFLLLAHVGGQNSLDFGAPESFPEVSAGMATALFVLALIGFGTKAGFMPLHAWLPQAHTAAPGFVSAVLSGVVIKTGIYGLLRMLSYLDHPPPWWGWVLIGVGAVSGLLGILFALAQHDLKRLLAYSSVENMGIVTLGIGIGLLGLSYQAQTLAALGFAGALLHVLNHCIFKSLLFLGAGTVRYSCGTNRIDEMGGLLKRMPWMSAAFLTGCVAISALPPLNGFVGEYLIYLGAFEAEVALPSLAAAPALIVIGGLALVGGLAAACFSKVFGVVFLGTARSDAAMNSKPPKLLMVLPMLMLAPLCLIVGLTSPLLLTWMEPIVAVPTGLPTGAVIEALQPVVDSLSSIVLASVLLGLLITALAVTRFLLLRGRQRGETVTWDCGYARPSATMQYTGSSFAQPLTQVFSGFIRVKAEPVKVEGYFPEPLSLRTDASADPATELLYQPAGRVLTWVFPRMRRLQHGQLSLYVLYIALTLLVLLVWFIASGA